MNWIEVNLTDIAKPKQWKNLPSKFLKEDGYPVYGANGVIGFYSNFNHKNPTLAITCRGATSGNIHLTTPYSYINSNAMALDDINETKYNLKFLYYALLTRGLKDVITGSAQPQITRTGLSRVKLMVPDNLDDQKRIAKILFDCESLIQKRKESIELVDEFLKSTFLEMFGDPGQNTLNLPVEKLNSTFSEKPSLGTTIPAIDDGVIPVVRVGELGSRNVNINKCKFSNIPEEKIEKSQLKHGDILLARAIGSESHLGKASIYFDLGHTVVFDSHVMRLRFNPTKINYEFFYTFLKTSGGRKRFMGQAGKTSIQFNINSKQISNIQIPIPPISQQNAFGKKAEEIAKLRNHLQLSLREIVNLYGSISQKAFKGDLDLSKVDISLLETEETKLEMEAIGKEKWVDKHEVQDTKVNLDEIIKNDFGSNLFSVINLEEAISNRALYVEKSQVKSFLKKAMDENIIEQVYSGDTKQVMFKLKK
ncbi:restriction endonuclease subunit S [Maribacter polysiphoniae]|uniref:Restriction endonuclease subunit S n=1 Tax=Maribacter polysiphoniae TaxID=429344 RepID=A0A316DYM6_9FLAO|nr:restriction endonuclease subunit S [Maribacter polysiphoniae]MBD1261514.1 restriction endonuclease subunit S [Maribacter polysiphoniae]PWK22846.1 type I restriction enzyme S subunit [Maribacter polysiphoniae]